MRKQILLLLLTQTLVLAAFTQVKTLKRIEFELKEGYTSHDLAKFKENGVLFYSKSTSKKGENREWKIEKYSSKLELLNTEKLSIPRDQLLDESYSTDTDLFLFFKSKRGKYSFFKINAKTLKIKKVIGELPKKLYVYKIHVLDDIVFFNASIKKAAMIFKLDLNSEREDLIPIKLNGYDPKRLLIEDIQVIDESKEVLVYINAYNKKEHDLYVIKFDNVGNEKSTFNLTKGHDMKLSSVSASYIGDDTYIYTGTYSKYSSVSSEGVYLCKTKRNELKFIEFYKFLDFNNFLSYLPERKQEKIKKKKQKKEKKGKELKVSYYMMSHDIEVIDGKYIYLGEAYYPTYRTVTTTTYVNGKPTTTTRQVFDGYQYTHAVIAGFDDKGEKLWDNTFEMWPSYKPYYRKKFISNSISDDRILNLLFSSRSNIESKSFYANGEVFKEKSHSLITTDDAEDIVKFSNSNLEHWYDKYFIAHGLQKIKNNKKKIGDKKKRVYFINKLSYK